METEKQELGKIITKAEMMVLEVMYALGQPMSMMEIRDAVNQKNGIDWKPQTVSTFLRRLCEKGITRMWREGRTFIHEPVLPYETFVGDLSNDFLNTWCKGNMSVFFDIFVKNVRPLTKEEVNSLFGPFLGRDAV